MPIGIGKTDAGRVGSVPQVNITGYHREVQKRLFYSRREQALILEKTARKGFGILEMGQVMTEVNDADFIVPHGDNGNTYLLENASSGQKDLKVKADYASRFAPGEKVVVADDSNSGNYEIDEISVSGDEATITVTSNLGETYQKSDDAYIKHRQDGNYYVLDQETDTGMAEEADEVEGALTSVVVGNAVLYKDSVIGMDSSARSNLNAHEDGIFYVIK